MKSKSKGVTLVELSIVLAVLGILIVVGISGRSFIDISRATATIKQLQDRDLAFQIFTSTYDCTPGDCGVTTVVGATGALSTVGVGNGNTRIEASTGVATTGTIPNELVYVEEHLVRAQLFNRAITNVALYTIDTAQGSGDNLLASILPSSKVPSAYISSLTVGNIGTYNLIGGASPTENIINNSLVSYPKILRIVDSKMDDASAMSGNIRCETTSPASTIATFANTTTDYSSMSACVLFAKMSI